MQPSPESAITRAGRPNTARVLNNGDDQYEDLFDVIRRFGQAWHDAAVLDSVWFLKTASTSEQVTDALLKKLKQGDNLFVVDFTGQPYQGWMPQTLWEWLS